MVGTAIRRKVLLILGLATALFLLNRIVFTIVRHGKNYQVDAMRKGKMFQRLQKEKHLERIRRISDSFAPYQNRFTSIANQSLGVTKQKVRDKEPEINNGVPLATSKRETKVELDIDIQAPDSFKLYFQDTTPEDLNDPFVNLHRYEYLISNRYACHGDVLAVIMVNSSPGKINERTMIRETWGSVRYYLGATIVPLFMLAKLADNDKLQKDIEKESETYLDIVQGNFIDSYRNLTYKTVMGLHWVQNFCNHTKFAIKVDDDTMIDIYHLVKFLFQKSPDGNMNNFLYCSVYKNQGPVRRSNDKWFVPTHEYPYSKYPSYCEGFAYIMSNDVTKMMYQGTREVKTYWIDDVYITGLVAYHIGLTHTEMESGHAYDLMQAEHLSKHVQNSIFLLAKYEHLRQNWQNAWNDIKTVHDIE